MKGKRHSLMNLFGLAISMTAVLLISLYIIGELSADRQHSKANRIYRISYQQLQPFPMRTALSSAPLGPAITGRYPGILSFVRMMYPSQFTGNFLVNFMDKTVYEDGVLFADTNFFDFFDYEFVYGNPEQALAGPDNIVLIKEKARLFFGDVDPVGQILRINGTHPMTVSAVVRPHKNLTHLRFHYLIPFYTITDLIGTSFGSLTSFSTHNGHTYLMVERNFDLDAFIEAHLEDIVRRYLARDPDAENPLDMIRLDFTPLREIYFDNNALGDLPNPDPVPNKGNKNQLLVFGLLAVFLSVIAVINYTNMSIARSTKRSKEVGVRKVLGTSPKQLFGQYIGEAGLFVLLALFMALLLSEILIPRFNSLMNKSLSLTVLLEPGKMLLLAGFVLIMSLISGSYPAVYMARIRPADALKGQFKIKGKTLGIKSILFSFQFFVSVFMIVCTLLVYQQYRYMEQKDMGFASGNRISFMLPDAGQITPEWVASFKTSLLQHVDIQSVSSARRNPLPGRMIETWSFPVEKEHGKEEAMLRIGHIDTHFLELFNIPVVSGRSFSTDYPSDFQNGVLLNETAVRDFGWKNPVGMSIQRYDDTYRVLGVVKDFHLFSLHQPIEPMMLLATNSGREVNVLLTEDRVSTGLQAIQETWKDFLPEYPLDYSFIETQLAATLSEERKTAGLLSVMAVFAIFISLAGLFGISAFAAGQHTREIAIRKTYGASLLNIVEVLSRGVGRLLGISLILAIPVSYLYMSRWLEGFSYRIALTPWPFLAAAGSAALIAFLTLWFHAAKTAAGNPVDQLRGE